MPGSISISFEREPSFFMGAGVEGDVHQTLVGKVGRRVVAMASRSIRDAYLDGFRQRIGYLSQLRIDPAMRGRRGLALGWERMRELHEADPVDLYLTTIIADNLAARRVLERDRPTKPRYLPRGRLLTLAMVPPRCRWARPSPGVVVRQGEAAMLPDLVSCLQRNGRRHQFATYWDEEILTDPRRCRDLAPEDFLAAFRGGRLVGCLAVWDQRGFKQNVVRGYSPSLRRARPLVNALSRVVAAPRLPEVGRPIPHATISHLAVDDDSPDVFFPLLHQALCVAREKHLSYLALGLMEGSPFTPLVRRRVRHIAYPSILYVVCWPDKEARARSLDDRPPHVEPATL